MKRRSCDARQRRRSPTCYQFSEEIRASRIKSGQTHIENRTGWAQSALVKAKFIEKHPSQKFTYQITDEGRAYLSKHEGPITVDDLRNIEGYTEAWEEASRRKQEAKASAAQNPNIETSTPSDLIEDAMVKIQETLKANLLTQLLDVDPYRFEQIVIDLLVAWVTEAQERKPPRSPRNPMTKGSMASSTKIASGWM